MNEIYKHDGMNRIFEIGGKKYYRKQFFCSTVAEKILPSFYGPAIKDVTYEQLLFITRVMNDGWTILPGFYGERTENGTLTKANLSWFRFVGTAKNENGEYCLPFQYTMCVNYNKYEISLYDFQGLIGTFPSYSDMLHCVDDKFIKMIPSKFAAYTSNLTKKDVEIFESSGCQFDEIYKKGLKVYESLDNSQFKVEIDYDRLEEVNE